MINWMGSVGMQSHGVIFHLRPAKVYSPGIIKIYFSQYKDSWIAVTDIIFAFSGVRCHTWFPVISGKSIYPIFTKFGMGVYWVNSLHGIAFGDNSFITE